MSSGNAVKGDGRSAIPEDVYDMTKNAEDVVLDEKVMGELEQLYTEALEYEDPLKAKFKLEIIFTEDRSTHHPFGGFIMAWTNGGYAHGGGDEAVYFCPVDVGDNKTCNNPIELKFISRKVVLCTKCRNLIDPKELCGQVFARLTLQNWADLVHRMYDTLGGNADIRLGALQGDLRRAALDSGDGGKLSEALDKVRGDRHWAIYTMKSVIKDTSAGADLRTRIRSFLSA